MNSSRRRIIQLSILTAGVILVVLGVIRGDALEILKKAVLVCMECIGIG